MISVKEVIVVEGRYDRNTLSQVFDAGPSPRTLFLDIWTYCQSLPAYSSMLAGEIMKASMRYSLSSSSPARY